MSSKPIGPKDAADFVQSPRWINKVTRAESGCHIWTAATNHGYGCVGFGGRTFAAHRIAWVAANARDIPPGLVVDHLCGVRRCVNPEHLDVVTQRINVLRSATAIPALLAARDACSNGHLLQADNLRPGARYRDCLQCRRDAGAAIAGAAKILGLTRRAYLGQYGHSKVTALEVLRGAT